MLRKNRTSKLLLLSFNIKSLYRIYTTFVKWFLTFIDIAGKGYWGGGEGEYCFSRDSLGTREIKIIAWYLTWLVKDGC